MRYIIWFLLVLLIVFRYFTTRPVYKDGNKVRITVISFYQKVLPEPYAGLIAGITLGSKGGLTDDFWEKVRITGVAHVVVASGMNVAFVASFLFGIASVFLPRRK